MTAGRPAAVERRDPPPAGDEVTLLRSFLDFHRDTLRLKTAGLGDADLHRAVPPTTMTLGGLLSHLTYVEDLWCRVVLRGDAPAPPWDAVDWAADRDADWHLAQGLGAAALRGRFDAAVAASDAAVDAVLADPAGSGLETLAARARHGERVSLRWILLHLVEEYARHNGHADLLREAVDGSTGE